MIDNEDFKHMRQANRRADAFWFIERIGWWIGGIFLAVAGLRYLYVLLFGE